MSKRKSKIGLAGLAESTVVILIYNIALKLSHDVKWSWWSTVGIPLIGLAILGVAKLLGAFLKGAAEGIEEVIREDEQKKIAKRMRGRRIVEPEYTVRIKRGDR